MSLTVSETCSDLATFHRLCSKIPLIYYLHLLLCVFFNNLKKSLAAVHNPTALLFNLEPSEQHALKYAWNKNLFFSTCLNHRCSVFLRKKMGWKKKRRPAYVTVFDHKCVCLFCSSSCCKSSLTWVVWGNEEGYSR